MNPHSKQTLEAVTDAFTLPVAVAARILGISLRKAKEQLPIVDRGYRSKEVTIASMREWIQFHETPKAS
jgi:hypothetical protein